MSTPMTSKSALGACRQQLSETKIAERYLCFGQFQVDLQREELFKEGSRVRGTFVNYDANVNTTINKLRLALGVSPEKPMYGRYRDRDIASRATSSVAPAC